MSDRPVAEAESGPPPPVGFREAARFWLKLGFISFGGPAGQIAIMHQELVERRRWISERRFLHALNYCMLLPGPEAQQLATYIGWLMHRTLGGLVAGGLFILPSFLILSALSWLYVEYGGTPFVASLFFGIKPAVVAIVAFAAYRIGSRVLRDGMLLAICIGALLAIRVLDVGFPWIVLGAGILGAVGGRVAPSRFAITGGHAAGRQQDYGPAMIDDDTPSPSHAEFRWLHAGLVIVVAMGAWGGMMAAFSAIEGPDGILERMGWFFTKAALLTFGGAYAVLPYVYQGAVEQYAWLTPLQMIDGLALGETTPGPLIIVVAFVGFLGAGMLGSICATWFTFLPSFLFIFLGAPLVESTRGNLRLTAFLTGITAAVVGVIVNLALFFAYHVLWPAGFAGNFSWISAVIALSAAIALFRFSIGVIPVILASGAIGAAMKLIVG